jgi:hypothetical protein
MRNIIIFLFLFASEVTQAQQVLWQSSVIAQHTFETNLLSQHVLVVGNAPDDSCSHTIVSWELRDRNTGFVTDTGIVGSSNCINLASSSFGVAAQFNEQALYAEGYIDNRFGELQPYGIAKFTDYGVDTIGMSGVDIVNFTFWVGGHLVVLEWDSLRIVDQNFQTTVVRATEEFAEIVTADTNANRIHIYDKIAATSGGTAFVIYQYDASLNELSRDTFDFYPGTPEELMFARYDGSDGSHHLVVRKVNSTDKHFIKIDSNGSIVAQTLIYNHRVHSIFDDPQADVIIVATMANSNNGVGNVILYKYDQTTSSIIDSTSLGIGVYQAIQGVLSADNYIYVAYRDGAASVNSFKVAQIDINFGFISEISIVDSTNNFIRLASIDAGLNGHAVMAIRRSAAFESQIFYVQLSPASVLATTANYCNIGMRASDGLSTQISIDGTCRPEQISVFSITGQLVHNENLNSNNFTITAPTTGIYIIQVLFENGEVKREKVFLTAN